MADRPNETFASRREVLLGGAVLGGGLLASAFAGGSVAAAGDDGDTGTGVPGFISRSSYWELIGADDVDCVPEADGWGGSFYVDGAAEDRDGEAAISIEVPDPSASSGLAKRFEAYTVTANEHVDLAGDPSGHGPWEEPCGTWVFVDSDASLEPAAVYRVSKVYDADSKERDYEGVTATDNDGQDIGSPMDLMGVEFERAPPAAQWTRSDKFSKCGATAAVDGTTGLLGPGGAGPACVIDGAEGTWTQETTLAEGDDSRSAPATDGETMLLRGPREGDTGNRSVFVYAETDGRWAQQAALLPDDLDEGAAFGGAYDVDGDTIAVGAPGDPGDNGRSDGAVYVYQRDGDEWTRSATLEDTRDIADTADGLGYDVAVDGDTVLAGAPYATYDDFGLSSVGGGLLFTRSDGEWRREAFLRSDNPDDGDAQGRVVALDGDTAVLASPRTDKGSSTSRNAGAAWVFTRDGSAWPQQEKVTPTDWERGDWFAADVALDGDRLLVGSDTRDNHRHDAAGAAYIFTREDAAWDQVVKLTDDDGEQFGNSVALSGEFAFIGARSDGTPDSSEGSVYVFRR